MSDQKPETINGRSVADIKTAIGLIEKQAVLFKRAGDHRVSAFEQMADVLKWTIGETSQFERTFEVMVPPAPVTEVNKA